MSLANFVIGRIQEKKKRKHIKICNIFNTRFTYYFRHLNVTKIRKDGLYKI